MRYPDFESADFLKTHISSILDFYAPHAFDEKGGFFHHFLDDGTIYDADTLHLVSSPRFVFNSANAYFQTGEETHRVWAEHGFAYLKHLPLGAEGQYIWQLHAGQVEAGRAMA